MRRLPHIVNRLFQYLGVLLVFLFGVVLGKEGLDRGEAAVVAAGALIAILALVWAIVGRARGGDLVP